MIRIALGLVCLGLATAASPDNPPQQQPTIPPHAAEEHQPGDRMTVHSACFAPQDALDLGVAVDLQLPYASEIMIDKLEDGKCFYLPKELVREDNAIAGKVVMSDEDTDVLSIVLTNHPGRTFYIPVDSPPRQKT
jgi:hypothetical protein